MRPRPGKLLFAASILLCTTRAVAQTPMPDRVSIGTSRTYWVDSTSHPGSSYTWAIDGIVAQQGEKCSFFNTWKSEGSFQLTLRQVSPNGCPGEIQTGRVLVVPSFKFGIYPNPLSGSVINFQLSAPVSSMITVDLFQSNGQRIDRIFEGRLSEGETRTIRYNRKLPHGIYPYQIITEYQAITGRIIILSVF